MPFHAASLFVIAALAANLGTPLRQDGYTIRPPAEFRLARMELFSGTKAGAVATVGGEEEERYLSAALTEGEGPDAATLLIAIVDRPFDPGPSSRDAFTTAAMKHFAEELGLPLTLVRAELIDSAPRRVEVVGTLKQQDQLRTIVLAAMEGDPRHAVVTFSVPSARFDLLWPDLRASLESFRADAPPGATVPSTALWTVAVALGLGLFASWRLWRRRLRLRRADQGLPG